MTRFEPRAAAPNRRSASFSGLILGVIGPAAALAYVAHVVARHTIALVDERGMLPRWDLATHLVFGWTDYRLLAAGRIHSLVWDLWQQGYWPPLHSLFQIPFYIVLGGRLAAGLSSSLAAFVLAGVAGSLILWRQWRFGAALPAACFAALLMSSPYLLAYASVAMTEMLGAFVELVVVFCYAWYRHDRDARSARAFAMSLTLLFFTKYNYFLLLVAPLVICEWLEAGQRRPWSRHAIATATWIRRAVTTPTGLVFVVYGVALAMILTTGGFEFHVLGRRVSVRSIGNTGYLVLYFALARLWSLHHHGRIDWRRLTGADPRVRPVVVWFALPVTIWFAIPYPNHIRDFANLVFNRPLGAAMTGGGAAAYVEAVRTSYFYSEWVLVAVIATFVVAAARYRSQPEWMRWLIVATPLQSAAIGIHQTRFPRFLLLTIVLLCVASSAELARWVSASRPSRRIAALLAPAVLVAGVIAARVVVAQERFQRVAFENYTDSRVLRDALESIRRDLTANDRLIVVGESNDLSPALFRWELGPPSGVACSPFQMAGARRLDPLLATRVLLIEPIGGDPGFALDVTEYYRAQRQNVLDLAGRGELVLTREIPLLDLRVVLRVYDRTSRPERLVSCD